MLKQKLAHIALVIDEYDLAIKYYTEVLQFDLVEDTRLSPEKRWVLVRPKGSEGCHILLARASNEEQKSRIGNQAGGRVFLFLHTNMFEEYHQHLLKNNVKIVREPVLEEWGKVLVFQDKYGNKWDLIQPHS